MLLFSFLPSFILSLVFLMPLFWLTRLLIDWMDSSISLFSLSAWYRILGVICCLLTWDGYTLTPMTLVVNLWPTQSPWAGLSPVSIGQRMKLLDLEEAKKEETGEKARSAVCRMGRTGWREKKLLIDSCVSFRYVKKYPGSSVWRI